MRVGILASELQSSPTGVGRFLRGLIAHLPACRPEWNFTLFFQGDPFDDPLLDDPAIEAVFFSRGDDHPVLFEQFRLARLLPDLDVFLGPAYSLPRGLRCPGVVAIHDLSFEVLPEEFAWRERWRRRLLARRAARTASRVLTLSSLVSTQLQKLYGVPRDRIAVLPLAVDVPLFRASAESVAPAVEPPFLLFAGSIFPRRRVDVVLEAFSLLLAQRPNLRLVLAGANRLRKPELLSRWIDDLGIAKNVVRLGYVDNGQLAALMKNAEASFYLSTYEGYGLPPLEALSLGSAVLTSPGQALDDLWPQYPYRCAAIEAREVSAIACRILDDADERARVLSQAERVLAGLSWERTAELFSVEVEKAVEP